MPYKETLTEGDLRGRCLPLDLNEICVNSDVYITQGAKEFLKERKIQLKILPQRDSSGQNNKIEIEHSIMTQVDIPKNVKYRFAHAFTGAKYVEKPENMTHLYSNQLIEKSHPIISFRGSMDSLLSEIICVQFAAQRNGAIGVVQQLQEILDLTAFILSAEVKNKPMETWNLFGFDEKKIRDVSQNVRGYFGIDHIIPNYKMGETAILLNHLRTSVRKCELSGIKAISHREDILLALNRLSSAVYIIFCQLLTENKRCIDEGFDEGFDEGWRIKKDNRACNKRNN